VYQVYIDPGAWEGAAANGLAYLPVKQGNAFELHRLQHFTSPATRPSVSLVVDVCGTASLVDATTYMEDAFESVAFAAAPAPERNELLTPPLTKRFGFANQKDPEQVEREAHELFHSNLELIDELAYIKVLEQPATRRRRAKEADAFTCKGCTGKYTDGSGSGSGTKYNCGYCSSECREAAKGMCEHVRRKGQCKDCGTGQ
jgi:hypothetical protein